MGDIQGLMETVKDLKLDKQTSLLKTLQTGVFTLRDLYQQFQTIMSMGPLSKVMGMLPGMSPEMLSAVGDDQGNNKLKTFMCIMDSMTASELDSDAKMFYESDSRLYRVARGSGATVVEVQQLLMQYKMVGYSASFVKPKGYFSTLI